MTDPIIGTYDLGKWWPGGICDYKEWKDRQILEFMREYVLVSEQSLDTYTGGVHLYATGYKKPISNESREAINPTKEKANAPQSEESRTPK